MNRLRRLSLVLIATVSLAGLPGCNTDTAKKKVDKAGNKVQKAADKAKSEAEKAKKDVNGQ
jgi:hypothetical protein